MTSEAILIPEPDGVACAPSAVLANLAQGVSSRRLNFNWVSGRRTRRSVTAIMGLEVTQGAKVQVVASGPDAAAAVKTLAEMLEKGLRG